MAALWQIAWIDMNDADGVAIEIEPTTLRVDDDDTVTAINGLELRCAVSGKGCLELSGEIVAETTDAGLSLSLVRASVTPPMSAAKRPVDIALRPLDRVDATVSAETLLLGRL